MKFGIKLHDVLSCNACMNGYILRPKGSVPMAHVCWLCEGTGFVKVMKINDDGHLYLESANSIEKVFGATV